MEKSGVKFFKNVLITMSDGVKLAADLWMPDSGGKFPCIVMYQPYHKDDIGGATIFESLPRFFAEKGYCYALLDARGTGSSEGACAEPYSPQEQTDGYEVVEWLAGQDWCDANVGMMAWSQSFLSCLLVAAKNPPHLKAVVPMYGTPTPFHDGWEGGSLGAFHHLGYHGSTMAALNCMPPTFRDEEGRWIKMWNERIEKNVPWLFDFFEHKGAGDYDLRSIAVPTLIISSWYDPGAGAATRLFAEMKSPKRLIVGPWLIQEPDASVLGPRLDYHPLLLRWFDHWLRGEQNGVMDEPPVLVYTAEFTSPDFMRQDSNPWVVGSWRRPKEWPPGNVAPMDLYLHRDGVMKAEVPVFDGGSHFFIYDPCKGTSSGLRGGVYSQNALPIDQTGEEGESIVFTTAPLTSTVEVNGRPEVVLAVESSAKTAAVAVRLCEVSTEGSTTLVASGYLNLTRRDAEGSGNGEPTPVARHEIYTVKVSMNPISYNFTKHHRIKLIISGADFPNKWPTPESCVTYVHFGKRYLSRVVLPAANLIVDRIRVDSPGSPAPSMERMVSPEDWKITREMRRGRVTVEWSRATELVSKEGFTINQKWHITESADKASPVESTMEANYAVQVTGPGSIVELKSKVLLRGEKDFYYLFVGLDIEYDGAPYSKSIWSDMYPRGLT